MNKIVLAILSLCLISRSGYSQDYVVSLEKQSITLSERDFYVAEVVDARLEKSNIGTVQTGVMNSRKIAVFPKELPQTLMEFFNKHLPPANGMKPVIVKVLKLQVKEQTRSFSEAAYAEVSMDFFYQDTSGRYLKLYQAYATGSHKGMDVTARHDENIAVALQECLAQFAGLDAGQLMRQAAVVEPQHLTQSYMENAQPADYAVITDNSYRKGVYQNFLEFRNNSPSITQTLAVEKRPRTAKTWQGTHQVIPYLVDENGRRKNVRRAWGFSDGEQLYIHFQHEYYPLTKAGNVFTFYGHVPTPTPVVYTGGLVGGAIGGAVVGVAAAAATSNSKAQFVLDIVTGRITEMGNYTHRATVGDAKIVVYCRATKHSSDQPVQIQLKNREDSLVTELTPNSSVELSWSNPQSEIMACVPGTSTGCHTFLPDLTKPNYLELVLDNESASQPLVKSVKAQEAEFYLKKIRYAQEIAEKRKRK